jgi:ABC-type multidrug transport system fused ATPase/permease subunit
LSPVLFHSLRSHLAKVLFLVGSARGKLFLLLPLYLIASAADVVGIGLLVALISALRDPTALTEVVAGIPVASGVAGSVSADILMVMLAGLVLFVYVAKTAISLTVIGLMLKISFRYGAGLRSFMMGVYQRQSYSSFMQRNSSEYIYSVQTLAGQFVTYTIQPLLRITSDGLLALLIICYLAVTDPFVLAILLLLISLAGLFYDRAHKRKMAMYGGQENKLSANMIKSITEALNAYRESQIFGVQGFFHRTVDQATSQLAEVRIRSHRITASSRYILEFVVVVSVVCVIVASVAVDRDREALLTTLVLFLVASTRLLPATNQIVINLGNLRYGRHSVEALHADITGAGYEAVDLHKRFNDDETAPAVKINDSPFGYLELRDVAFRYASDGPWVLEGVDLRLERCSIVGIVGPSGSGKSTLVALMLGFLMPQRGCIIHDGADLAKPGNVKAWHGKVAYLPQEVLLVDDTLAHNIALGVASSQIDRDKLDASIAKASLTELVAQMPQGVDTPVGEKGLWVSGGQRQRIALARAFYFDAEVLVMDESTSALDAETVDEIAGELRQLKDRVTIVVITHQEALLGLCNKVYRVADGRIVCVRGV